MSFRGDCYVLNGSPQLPGKLVFVALRKRCHCEERSDVAIPRLNGTR